MSKLSSKSCKLVFAFSLPTLLTNNFPFFFQSSDIINQKENQDMFKEDDKEIAIKYDEVRKEWD